ncbi:hypothetical protein [Staphylococcus hominis]|jgi:hypothetical protein|uniref:hypothetical protein n=1 Tax=Staphylococcus hominis TaxID=1290 RepID=UPI000660C84E|nr:hypothetical protein [Staphylococcus hominis]MDU3828752.1 hypothetical protein [Staphylococcus sp.]MBC2908776.1 hypothetical protein [Staphylococcus hominis]MBC2911138.1 hypothetical protein [Staphylococcus hominis]MBC2913092.1 hypothetical protein [Staphylococcus hominis]MBC2935772.1 hypothetical protein [Staphylococcus hominis]
MANEIVKNTESYILVQVNEKGEEAALSNDFRGQFYPTTNVNTATKFDDLNKIKALASRLNSLNELNYEFGIIPEKVTVKPVKVTTLLEYVGETETNAE